MDPNFPPVGDIQMSKSKGTYNTYKLELSFGQIEAIRQALKAKHDDPIADELLAMFEYYMRELPGPGEDEEVQKDRQAAAQTAEDDFPIPMPPGSDTMAEEPGAPGEDEVPTEKLPKLGAAPDEGEAPAEAAGGEDEIDAAMRDVEGMDGMEDAESDTEVPEPPAE